MLAVGVISRASIVMLFPSPTSENTLPKIQACMVGISNLIGFDSQYVFTQNEDYFVKSFKLVFWAASSIVAIVRLIFDCMFTKLIKVVDSSCFLHAQYLCNNKNLCSHRPQHLRRTNTSCGDL